MASTDPWRFAIVQTPAWNSNMTSNLSKLALCAFLLCIPSSCRKYSGTLSTDDGVHQTSYSGSAGGKEVGSTDTCILRYDISAQIRVRDTTLNKGNYNLPEDGDRGGYKPSIDGQVYFRLETRGSQIVEGGKAELLYYDIYQNFRTGGGALVPDVTTNVWSYAPEPRGNTRNTKAIATGTVSKGGRLLRFPDCSLPRGWNRNRQSYTTDTHATGAGCALGWRSVGTVHCSGGTCSMGGLENGDNPQDDTWNQPLPNILLGKRFSTLAFADEGTSSAEPGFLQLPNNASARTYMRWTGTLDASQSTCDDL